MATPLARIVVALLTAPLAGCAVTPVGDLSKTAPIPAPDQQTIEMDAAGRLTLNGRETTTATLGDDLDAAFRAAGSKRQRSDQTVRVRISGDVTYEAFMELMNKVYGLGWRWDVVTAP